MNWQIFDIKQDLYALILFAKPGKASYVVSTYLSIIDFVVSHPNPRNKHLKIKN